jgi:D-alanyl-lipoteichoic acid acyltransferase DltB (MBOAT superfamily)
LLFNSYIFIFLFLPVTFFIYFYLNKKRLTEASKAFLVLSSLFFYAWWNTAYLPLILVSMLFNYTLGRELSKERKGKKHLSPKVLLIFGVAANLSLLGYFKYADFFIENIDLVFGIDIPLLHLALPLAISFYTFQQIAYLVDSYRKETREYDFLNYAVFVTFFPQLIAGPIVHHSEMMPQFAQIKHKIPQYKNIAAGIFIFAMGLFKKVVIADAFALWVTQGFDIEKTLTTLEAWTASLSYTFQLYFDFSGYTDMAIGIALLFNIKLPINFFSPYKATSIQDFWRRWHITLSRFLKDYIYIPLGGNRKGELRTYTNLFTTFLLGGIWHGAGWTFVLWGALHGTALIIHRVWQKIGFRLPAVLAWFITFNFINIAWVFFRAKTFEDAHKVLHAMFNPDQNLFSKSIQFVHLKHFHHPILDYVKVNTVNLTIYLIILGLIISIFAKNSNQWSQRFMHQRTVSIWWMFFAGVLLGVSFITIGLNRSSEFLYFNF